MKPRVLFALLLGFTGVIHASDNSIEVTLEDTPADEQSQFRAFEVWRHKPAAQELSSDGDFAKWKFKFDCVASDKRLGSAADTAAIEALVPATRPPTIRWVSRSVLVVAAACHSDDGGRCLYVFKKHGSKWKVTHHYYYLPPHHTF
jgi:hypothetical protein